MAELVHLSNGCVDLLFHGCAKNFKGEHNISHRGYIYKLQTDKNNSICNVVLEFDGQTSVESNKRDLAMLNILRGNPLPIAIERLCDEIDYIVEAAATK